MSRKLQVQNGHTLHCQEKGQPLGKQRVLRPLNRRQRGTWHQSAPTADVSGCWPSLSPFCFGISTCSAAQGTAGRTDDDLLMPHLHPMSLCRGKSHFRFDVALSVMTHARNSKPAESGLLFAMRRPLRSFSQGVVKGHSNFSTQINGTCGLSFSGAAVAFFGNILTIFNG